MARVVSGSISLGIGTSIYSPGQITEVVGGA